MFKYAVALSGGVDSSTTLSFLSKHEGIEVHAFTMKLWDDSYNPELKNSCFGYGKQEDIDTCTALCKSLNVPYTVIDLSKSFKTKVINQFKESYKQGITPNPCVTCNKYIKFGEFWTEIKKVYDFDFFVTGHYADIKLINNEFYLKRVEDDIKDQTYFLSTLDNHVLSKTVFPLGILNMNKNQVREMAKEEKLQVADKKDSMSFADGKYSLLFEKEEIKEGYFTYQGKALSKHNGIVYYTVGQRAKISGMPDRLYVKTVHPDTGDIEVDLLKNIVKKGIIAKEFNKRPLFDTSKSLFIKLKQEGKLIPIVSVENFPCVKINVAENVMLTPGQVCAIYNENNLMVGSVVL